MLTDVARSFRNFNNWKWRNIQPAIMGRWVLGQSKVIDRIYFQTETSRNCSIDENEIKKNTQLNKWTVQRISLKFLHVSSQFRLKWVLARYTCPLIFFFVKIPRIESKKLTFSSFLTFFQCDRLNIKKLFPDDWRFFSHDNPLPHLASRTWRKRK